MTGLINDIIEAITEGIIVAWQQGNYWLRIAILVAGGWLLLLTGVAMTSSMVSHPRTVMAFFAFIPVIGILAATAAYPMALVIAGQIPIGRRAVASLYHVLGLELVLGIGMTIVPVWNDPVLVMITVTTVVAMVVLRFSNIPWGRPVVAGLWILVGTFVFVFFIGGIDATTTAFAPTPPRSYPVVRPACKAPGNEFIWAIHDGGGGTFYVPPGGCETPVLVMPEGWFTACRRATVEVKRHYVDGSSDPDYVEIPPTQDRKPLKQVTGFSYRNNNSGETPIHVVAGERCG